MSLHGVVRATRHVCGKIDLLSLGGIVDILKALQSVGVGERVRGWGPLMNVRRKSEVVQGFAELLDEFCSGGEAVCDGDE